MSNSNYGYPRVLYDQTAMSNAIYPRETAYEDTSSIAVDPVMLSLPKSSKAPSMRRFNPFPARPISPPFNGNNDWERQMYDQEAHARDLEIDHPYIEPFFPPEPATPPADDEMGGLQPKPMKQGSTGRGSRPSGSRGKPASRGGTPKGVVKPISKDEKRQAFLERNKVAARKCRENKKVWIKGMENLVRDMGKNNIILHAAVKDLKEEVTDLKRLWMQHYACGHPNLPEALRQAGQATYSFAATLQTNQQSRSVSSYTSSGAPTRVGSPSEHGHPRRTGDQRPTSRRASNSDDNMAWLLTQEFNASMNN